MTVNAATYVKAFATTTANEQTAINSAYSLFANGSASNYEVAAYLTKVKYEANLVIVDKLPVVATYNYLFADFLKYWNTVADLILVAGKVELLTSYALPDSATYANLALLQPTWSTGTAYGITVGTLPGKTVTESAAAFYTYLNYKKSDWTFVNTGAASPAVPTV